jgi:hypothetical protein
MAICNRSDDAALQGHFADEPRRGSLIVSMAIADTIVPGVILVSGRAS